MKQSIARSHELGNKDLPLGASRWLVSVHLDTVRARSNLTAGSRYPNTFSRHCVVWYRRSAPLRCQARVAEETNDENQTRKKKFKTTLLEPAGEAFFSRLLVVFRQRKSVFHYFLVAFNPAHIALIIFFLSMVAGQDLFYSVSMRGKMKGKKTCHDEKKDTLGSACTVPATG